MVRNQLLAQEVTNTTRPLNTQKSRSPWKSWSFQMRMFDILLNWSTSRYTVDSTLTKLKLKLLLDLHFPLESPYTLYNMQLYDFKVNSTFLHRYYNVHLNWYDPQIYHNFIEPWWSKVLEPPCTTCAIRIYPRDHCTLVKNRGEARKNVVREGRRWWLCSEAQFTCIRCTRDAIGGRGRGPPWKTFNWRGSRS